MIHSVPLVETDYTYICPSGFFPHPCTHVTRNKTEKPSLEVTPALSVAEVAGLQSLQTTPLRLDGWLVSRETAAALRFQAHEPQDRRERR